MNRISGHLLLLSVVLLCGARSQNAPAPLTVMTFNIRYGTADDGENAWPKRKDLLFATIRSAHPDILSLQEALRFQLDDLHTALPGYTEIGAGRDDGKTAGEYSAIFVRTDRLLVDEGGTYWLSDTPEEPGSMSWGNRIPRICSWASLLDRKTNEVLYVFNTHWDHESQSSREKSAGLMLESIAHFTDVGDPVIVTGDFNAGERNTAFRALLSSDVVRLSDTYRHRHPKATRVGTFNGFTGDTKGEKIDAILVSDEWSVQDAEIIRSERDGRYPSDHFPVVATLIRKER